MGGKVERFLLIASSVSVMVASLAPILSVGGMKGKVGCISILFYHSVVINRFYSYQRTDVASQIPFEGDASSPLSPGIIH